MGNIIAAEDIERKIYLIRGQKIMLDADLSQLYGVETKQINRSARRNIERFPGDFMFQLTVTETEALRCQFGTSKLRRGGRRYMPLAFTELGVAMLSSILRSNQAIQVNIGIMRAFVNLRKTLAFNKELANKFQELEGRISSHDVRIENIFDAIRKLMTPPKEPSRRIGFQP